MTDFVNLKINSVQFFEDTHKSRICGYVFIRECSCVYKYLRLNCVLKKRIDMSKLINLVSVQTFLN
jgi:hypothetical protein